MVFQPHAGLALSSDDGLNDSEPAEKVVVGW